METLVEDLRASWQRTDDLLAKLRVQPGAVVADIGAGEGYLSSPLVDLVGLGGTVYAVEMQESVCALRDQAIDGVTVIESVNGHILLPDECLDAALIVSVVGFARRRTKLIRETKRLLKPGARIVILDQELSAHMLIELLLDFKLEILEADPRFIETQAKRRPLVVARKART